MLISDGIHESLETLSAARTEMAMYAMKKKASKNAATSSGRADSI